MPTVLIGSEPLRRQPGLFRTSLELAGFRVVDPTVPSKLSEADLYEWLPACDSIIAGGETISASIMDAAPGLRAIARTGVGYDAVDVAAASARNIAVTITPGTNQEAVAELTFALLLGLVKDIRQHDQNIRSGLWERTHLPRPVRGLTMGIVGLGRIGRAVATRALAFGMNVVAFEPMAELEVDPGRGITLVPFDELLSKSDVVSLHLPLGDATRGLFDRSTFSRMKPGALLINTARGGLIVEGDLVEALRSGQVGGAGLDVFGLEPPEADNPLWSLPNVLLTPHMAGVDHLAMSQMAELAALCLIDLHQGRWPTPCVVNPEVATGWRW
jgi:D-3-phosphoglycerate dehydrogenase / 2-oxoglutarate reductase